MRILGRRRSRGQAIVELALLLPILMILFLGALDLGRLFQARVTAEAATRAGASWGAGILANATQALSPVYAMSTNKCGYGPTCNIEARACDEARGSRATRADPRLSAREPTPSRIATARRTTRRRPIQLLESAARARPRATHSSRSRGVTPTARHSPQGHLSRRSSATSSSWMAPTASKPWCHGRPFQARSPFQRRTATRSNHESEPSPRPGPRRDRARPTGTPRAHAWGARFRTWHLLLLGHRQRRSRRRQVRDRPWVARSNARRVMWQRARHDLLGQPRCARGRGDRCPGGAVGTLHQAGALLQSRFRRSASIDRSTTPRSAGVTDARLPPIAAAPARTRPSATLQMSP